RALDVEDRVHALAVEAARDARELERRLEKAALRRLTGLVVVLAVPQERLERAGLAAVLGGEDAAVADQLVLALDRRPFLLDDDAKRVAFLGVVEEVDVVREYVDKEVDERAGLARGLHRGVER